MTFPFWKKEFLEGVIVESWGMVFDLFVIGWFVLWLNHVGEKRRTIERYKEEISDFLGWKSDEAMYRIVGNIKRLNRYGVSSIDLKRAFLRGADLYEANLSGADLREANFIESTLIRTDLREAILMGANLRGAYLSGADLSETILIDADLREAILSGAILSGADLRRTNLHLAILSETDLSSHDSFFS
jgi:BTB/POZ domain-containing protein KCTD9